MPDAMTTITPDERRQHLAWLSQVTRLPTAAGREWRVERWIERWVAERPELSLTRDPAGNMTVAMREPPTSRPPVYFTAHLDHPAFVVERVLGEGRYEVSFRGGVMDDYFKGARIVLHASDDSAHPAALDGVVPAEGSPYKHYAAVVRGAGTAPLAPGDVGVWDLPPPEVVGAEFHTSACDDLAALVAALAAMDVLIRRSREKTDAPREDVRLLFTRAEEIGFIGAIAATRHGTIPRHARVIALENSRSFADSPIGGGPIVRVGDRISVFSPGLTDAVAKRAEEIAGGAAQPRATEKASSSPAWKWQRKLMAGGACEASVFCAAGLEATCVCLPLGNYHNMGDLAAVQAGANTRPATIEREFIAVADFEALVDLLVACGERLPEGGSLHDRFEKLWHERSHVLDA